MAICACCNNDKKLTGEHIIPHGLLRRLAELDIRPNKAWSMKADKFYKTNDPIVSDLCAECQQKLHGLFDEKVDNFFIHIKAGLVHLQSVLSAAQEKRKIPSLEIAAVEPWFTLYMVRIAWNIMRQDKRVTDFQSVFNVLKTFILSEGDFNDIPENTFISLTYKPPVNYKAGKGVKSPLYGLYYAHPLALDDGTPTTRISLDLVCYRLLIGEVEPSHASRSTVRNYFRNVVQKHNGVHLRTNEKGEHKYTFEYLDPVLKVPWGTATDKLMTDSERAK